MISKNYKLLKDHPNSYEIHDEKDGKTFHIAKNGLSLDGHAKIAKMQHFDEGGFVADQAPDPSTLPASGITIAGSPSSVTFDPNNVPIGVETDLAGNPIPIQPPQDSSVIEYPTDSTQGPSPASIPVTDQVSTAQAAPIPGDGASRARAPGAAATDSLTNSYQAEKNANTQTAQLTGSQADLENDAIQKNSDKIDAMPSQSDIVAANKAKSDALFDAYQSKKIDPDRIWTTGGKSKVAAGIGMILGGAGSATTGQPNYAMENINNAINRDIDAQKADKSDAMNAWKMNRQALGDDLAANLTTQNQMYTGLKYKLASAANTFKGPLAMAAAKATNAQIDQKLAMNNAQLGLHAGLTGQTQDGTTEQGFVNNLNAAQRLAPEMAKDAQSKYLPGVGVARVPVSKEDTDTLKNLDDIDQQLDRGIQFAKTKGTTAPGTVANQQASDIQNGIQLGIGNLVGLKRINEFEAKKYTDMAGNPGAFRTAAAVQSFQDLKKLIADKKASEMRNLGVTPFRTTISPPLSQPQGQLEGKTASDGKGNRIIMQGGRWVPYGG